MKPVPCSLMRRIMALLYDAIVFIAFVFLAWHPMVLLPETAPYFVKPLKLIYLFALGFIYFGWQWKKGATLGMSSWNIIIVSEDYPHKKKIGWRHIAIRFLVGSISCFCFGAGLLFCFFSKTKSALHDRIAKTRLIINPKDAK